MNSQQTIYDSVRERGYLRGPNKSEILKQILKLSAELGELASELLPSIEVMNSQQWEAMDLISVTGVIAERAFKLPLLPEDTITVSRHVSRELADIEVVVCVLAELLNVNVRDEALDKSMADINRGVKK